MAENFTPDSPPKKPKWPRRYMLLLGTFFVFCMMLNGPIARELAHYGINKALESQGMNGNCQVKGTLTHGFTISDFSYKGTASLQKIQLDEVAADYRLLRELIHGKIRSAHLANATIVLDLDQFVSKEKEKESTRKIKETLKLVRKWVSQPKITFTNIDLTLLKSGKHIAQFQFDKLHHPANSDIYQLSGFQARDGSGLETPKQDVTLTWTEGLLELTRLEFFPDLALNSAQIDWTQELSGAASIQVLNATLDVTLNKTIDVKLTSGSLSTETIQQRFGVELPLDFELSHIEARVTDWLAPIQDWQISCSLDLPKISYQDYIAENTHLRLSQANARYQLALTSTVKSAPIKFEIEGSWTEPTSENWWENTKASYSFACERFEDLPTLIPQIPEQIDLSEATTKLQGDVEIKNLALYTLDTEIIAERAQIGTETLPKFHLKGNYIHKKRGKISLTLEQENDTPISAQASYTFENSHYDLSLRINEDDPVWLNSIIQSFGVNFSLQSPLDISWIGNGTPNLTKKQLGELQIESLKFKANHGLEFDLKAEAAYDWPHSLSLSTFELREEDFLATAKFDWDGKILQLHEGVIHRAEKPLANLTASIPFTPQIISLEKFLTQDTPWKLDLDVQPLDIQKINEWLQLHEIKQIADLTGSVAMGLDLIGSPSDPDIKGYTKLENLRGISNQDLAPLHMLGEFNSANKSLSFSGKLLEDKTERATLNTTLPFKPLEWVQQADNIETILEETTLEGELKINTLPLDRAARIVPQLKEIKGTLNGDAAISGTLADPKVELDTRINIPLLVTEGDEFDDIRDIEILCKANTERQIDASFKATVNGGVLKSKAKVDLADFENPSFEITAKATHAMAFRNDAVSVRANADIKLAGTLEEAALSGTIGVVESLFYKDIDILPIGVPSSAVADVELPALNSKLIDIAIPEPFNKWKLDLALRFEDPLLIRGNIARGQIGGGIKASGTLEDPKLTGTITADKVVARLPFSELTVDKGKVEFKPENGLIPHLDIQGKSTVNNYDTSIFIYGPATSPKTTFTSYPPLAKNDIMTLLATGITASGLSNNTGAATLRAAQLFLAKLKQESGDTASTKVIEKVLDSIQEFEFNINETDGFTGRKFSSAQVKLNRRFYLAAQIDDNNQTRGLLVYVLRFR